MFSDSEANDQPGRRNTVWSWGLLHRWRTERCLFKQPRKHPLYGAQTDLDGSDHRRRYFRAYSPACVYAPSGRSWKSMPREGLPRLTSPPPFSEGLDGGKCAFRFCQAQALGDSHRSRDRPMARCVHRRRRRGQQRVCASRGCTFPKYTSAAGSIVALWSPLFTTISWPSPFP